VFMLFFSGYRLWRQLRGARKAVALP